MRSESGFSRADIRTADRRRVARRGFNLVEIMVALLVVAVGFTALLGSVSVGLNAAQKSNANLTAYLAARSFADQLEAHYRYPLNGLVVNTDGVASINLGTWPSSANDFPDPLYVPARSQIKEGASGTLTINNYHSTATSGLVLTGYPSPNFEEDRTYSKPAASPTPIYSLPANWNNVTNNDAMNWGPYKLMIDFEHLDTFDTPATRLFDMPYREFRVTIWVFAQDFPRRGNGDYGENYNYNFTPPPSAVLPNLIQLANRRKEALGVYEFILKLGKAAAPFQRGGANQLP